MTETELISKRKFYGLLGILFLLALAKALTIIYFPVDLQSEEAQYWLWSKHLQLSYYSKPPLIAYLNHFSTLLLGDTILGVRINAVITGLLLSIATYFLALEIFKSQPKAIVASLISNVFPFVISISSFYTTDTPLLFFWTCAMLFYWKATYKPNPLWWILFGLSVGLGALSKYSMWLIFLPIILYALANQRWIFKSIWFYISIVISAILFSPVIYWNLTNNGVGVSHIVALSGAHSHPQTILNIIQNVLEFVLGQIAILLPFYQYQTLFRKFRAKSFTKEETFLLLPAICMLLIFLVVAFVRKSGVYINWTMFAYVGIPVLFAHFSIDQHKLKTTVKVIASMFVAMNLFAFLTSSWNTIAPLGKSNPANKVIGWSQLAQKVDSLKKTIAPNDAYIFSSNYHIASEMSFSMEGHPSTYVLNLNSRMTQFDLWPGIEQFNQTNKVAIFVDGDKITSEIKAGFDEILHEDSCLIYSQNCLIDKYYIYFLRGQKGILYNHPSSY
ncbi:MAG TPA: glycosyltransferase family 39 protein [Prolixibacteraceae bacterium]|nr:glycosyltransferase family 39 protein [Prolixibacteraceae bacterium]